MNRLKLAGIEKAPSPNLVIGSDSNGNTTWQEPSGGWGSKPLTPTNQRPINGEVNIIENPLFESTDFAHPFGLSMYGYQLVIKEGETVVYDSGNLELTITKFQIPKGKIVTGTTYSWSVRYQDHQLNWSDWSTPTAFTTQAVFGAGSVDTPFLLLPTNGSALNSPYPLMLASTWGSTGNLIPGDSTFEISRDPSFATVIESVTRNSRVFQSALAYPRGEVFCARVKDRATTGEESLWSSMSCFSVRTLYREQRIGLVLVDPVNWIFQRVDGSFNRIDVDSDYWLENAIYQGLTASAGTMIDGQEMLILPSFWIDSGVMPQGLYAGKRFWMIDPVTPSLDERAKGWHRHDAFYSPIGGWQDSLKISAHRIRNVGNVAVSTGTGTVFSASGNATHRALVNARNTDMDNPLKRGWHVTNYREIEAIKLLALIEHGNLTPIYDQFVATGAPYRGVKLWDNNHLMVEGLYIDRALLMDNATYLNIPLISAGSNSQYKIEHIYGKDDGASSVFQFDDWLIPRNVTGAAPSGDPSKSLLWKAFAGANANTATITKTSGVVGYSFLGSSNNALMSKWD